MQAVFFQLYQIFFRPFRWNFLETLQKELFKEPLERTFQTLYKELFSSFRRNILQTLQKELFRLFRRNFLDPLEGTFQDLQKELFRDPLKGTFQRPFRRNFLNPLKKEPFRPFKKESFRLFRPFRRSFLDPLEGTFKGLLNVLDHLYKKTPIPWSLFSLLLVSFVYALQCLVYNFLLYQQCKHNIKNIKS